MGDGPLICNDDQAAVFRADNFMLPVLSILQADPALVGEVIEDKVGQAPEFFRHTPVVLDLTALAADAVFDLREVIAVLRGFQLVPVGLRAAASSWQQRAKELDLAILREHQPAVRPERRAEPSRGQPAAVAADPPSAQARPGLVVDKPIRSGQRIYARGRDLVVLSTVSSGAELMADGHIHVFSALRGRALAGVSGDAESRIFCSDLQAELVAIAGHYRVSEDIADDMKGHWVQILMKGEMMVMESL